MTRRAGLLLHVTSLPGRWGIGDLGPEARATVEWLDAAGMRAWQMLPLHPIDAYGCPYASSSAFALEPLLLSLDDLAADGWLGPSDLPPERPPGGRVDYPAVHADKRPALALAASRAVEARAIPAAFLAERPWVEAWALFDALRDAHGPRWTEWPAPLRDREGAALAEARDRLGGSVARGVALQWLVASQWDRLRAAASARGVALWGDLPIFVGLDSADVWSHRGLFQLDEAGRPRVVTGVPPDAFTPLGQRWGHPHYDLERHASTGWAWWIARAEAELRTFDVVRIDHFRGLAASWEIAAADEDARSGRWVPGPGSAMLQALKARFPAMPFVAEDLGVITDDVHALRIALGLPGMVVLQFAFGSDADGPPTDHPYLPHHHRADRVVYTGTHDNDTVRGWQRTAPERELRKAADYLGVPPEGLPWAMIRAAWRSVADTAVVPAQDLLDLGSEARMNTPGVAEGNWAWRLSPGALHHDLAARVRYELALSARC